MWLVHCDIIEARIKIQNGDYEEATNLLNSALKSSSDSKYTREEVLVLESMGDIAVALGEHDNAIRLLDRSKQIASTIGDYSDLMIGVTRRRGEALRAAGKVREAISCFNKAKTMSESCHDIYETGCAMLGLASCYDETGQYSVGYRFVRAAIDIFIEHGALAMGARSKELASAICAAWHKALLSIETKDRVVAELAIDEYQREPTLTNRSLLEAAWTYAIDAQNIYNKIGSQLALARCENLMVDLRSEGNPLWASHARAVNRNIADEVNNKPFIANAPAMKQLIALVDISATTTEPVLVTGETGTGKELIARLVHEKSDRAKHPFVPINCAAIPETLFEREFFGHARGAFTGADGERPGLCEAADGGTMFLDEIGDMPAYLQVKLLRMIQEGTFHRLGDPSERSADLRIIAATNAPLPELIAAGTFRQDLYYRLQTLEISLPPLRERPEDLDPLMRLFISKIFDDEIAPRKLFHRDVITVFKRYPWPGNVRELEAMTRRLALMARHSGRATIEMLPEDMHKWLTMKPATTGSLHLGAYVQKVERERISQALLITAGNRSEAARALGISRNQLYRKMDKFGIHMPV